MRTTKQTITIKLKDIMRGAVKPLHNLSCNDVNNEVSTFGLHTRNQHSQGQDGLRDEVCKESVETGVLQK
jgi:hypothetical protein